MLISYTMGISLSSQKEFQLETQNLTFHLISFFFFFNFFAISVFSITHPCCVELLSFDMFGKKMLWIMRSSSCKAAAARVCGSAF